MQTHASPGKLQIAWDDLRTSFWFVPTLLMLLGLGLAFLMRVVDQSLLVPPADRPLPWWIFHVPPAEARSILSNLLSAMITMASLVFSITMVVLTLGATQFGPRLIRNFMASALTQCVLGTFVMTIVYDLTILQSLDWTGTDMPTPFASMSIAILLMGVSAVFLVFFIHNLARSIVSETIIDRVGDELDHAVRQLPALDAALSEPPTPPQARAARWMALGTAGYIERIDFEDLADLARSKDIVLELRFRPGDYIAADGRHVRVIGHERAELEAVGLQRAVQIGPQRTPVQDPEYAIRHLVEIAVRALSPGTNDPYTAVAALHRLSASLGRLMKRRMPPTAHADRSGTLRVFAPADNYRSLISAAFDQIRQNATDKPLVLIHLIQSLLRIAEAAQLPEQFLALDMQMKRVAEDFERSLQNEADLEDLRRVWRSAKAEMDDLQSTALVQEESSLPR